MQLDDKTTTSSKHQVWHILRARQEVFVFLVLLITGAFLSLRTDTFLTGNNLFNVLRSFSWIAIPAFGECIVIITGGIDLSVGAVMALSALVTTLAMRSGQPVGVAVAAGLLTGGLLGWLNGVMVARVKLPPVIVTLGTMSIARGIAFGLTGGWPIRSLQESFRVLGQYDLPLGPLAIPLPVLIMLGVAVLVGFLLDQTVMGRYIYVLDSSERALAATGVRVVQVKVLVYSLCGLLTAIGGLLMTARLGVAAPTAAMGYELDIIAAAVVGGTSLFGGQGSVVGVLLGASMMQVIRNGLVLLGFPSYWQTLALGAMILLAILMDYWRRQRSLV